MQQQTKAEQKDQYKETELGLLPGDWEIVRLGDVADYINGFAFKPTDWKSDGLPIIRIQNLTNSSDKINYYQGQLKEKYRVHAGDLLISWSASLGVFKWNQGDAWLNQHIFKVDEIKSNTCKDYLYYVVMTRIESMKEQTHGSTMHHITKKEFLGVLIPLPPLREQQKIAYTLTAIQTAQENTDKVITALMELNKAMMKHLFAYGPVSFVEVKNVKLKETEIGMIPNEWNITELKNQIKIIDCKHVTPTYIETGVPLIRPRNLKDGKINYDKVEYISEKEYQFFTEKHAPTVGDIIFSRNASYGNCAYINSEQKICIGQDMIVMTKKEANTLFIYYLLYSDVIKKQINYLSTGSTIHRINLKDICRLMVPIPNIRDQEKIIKILISIDEKIQSEQTKKNSLDELFKSMLHNLMTAKIRVNNMVMPNAK